MPEMKTLISQTPSPGKRSKMLESTLCVKLALHEARNHLFWGCINVIIMTVLLYDVFNRSNNFKKIDCVQHQLEIILSGIFFINTLFHFGRYLYRTYSIEPIVVSPTEKKLLGIKPTEPYFKTSPKCDTVLPDSDSSHLGECEFKTSPQICVPTTRWVYPPLLSECNSSTAGYSKPNESWLYLKRTPTVLKTSSPVTSVKDFITDEQSLSRYIQDYEDYEKKAAISTNVQETSNSFSFWSPSNSSNLNEVSPILRRCTYQLSILSPVLISNSPGANVEESGSPSAHQQNQEVWRKFKVDPNKLIQWNANLRMWISQTVLQRLVKEFDKVDEAFQNCGWSDMHLGLVGLERLKKTANIPQVAAQIPSLPKLVPFLEITPHQEYLITRIKELAKGGSMSEYRWDSGGSFNGKNWEEHLPTDAAVVMHLIATYLDSQLLFFPQYPEGRPFTAHHFLRSPEKPKVTNVLTIYQSQLNPPHFILLDNNDRLEMSKGRNNLFHTILLFLHILKTKEHGMLRKLNLGPSGVNILWVIDE
ncbi:UNVERIFIED_CONTAM: hypothetical protein PYX00_000065 [Menopon gallinae]|uniref:Transmembrane protein 209 n=1 Tax=Menopon gallinae TaxID=328185 RepID=A0AAW2I7N1_9NEOP